MKLVYKVDRARNGNDAESHSPEDAILAPAEFLEFRSRTISEKMPQDIAALAAIENKIQFRLRDVASQSLEKLTPGITMHIVAVDEDAIHIKDDTAQVAGDHEISPGDMRCVESSPFAGRGAPGSALSPGREQASPSRPGQVICAFW
jgi:hypothetical protein